MFLIDAGTSYIKTHDTISDEIGIIHITDLIRSNLPKPDYITGHNMALAGSGKFVNELVCLAAGARSICKDSDMLVLDIGSRDMKLVSFKKGKFDKCDWNTSCGAMIGFTIELIMKYFNKRPSDLHATDKHFDITCGLLGITKFFDEISKDASIEDGVSRLISGMARFAWKFAGKPNALYLSGGLSDNPVFIDNLKKLAPGSIPIGRFVLLEGLKNISERTKISC